MIQVDEYALAIFIWAISAAVLFCKAIHWKGFANYPRLTPFIRLLYLLCAIGFLVLVALWSQVKRGDKPWTSLNANRSIPVAAKDKPQPKEPQQVSPPQEKQEPPHQATRKQESMPQDIKSIPHHKLPPLIKEGAVTTVIPFNKDGMSAGIPNENNTKDPLEMTYNTLASIGRMPSRNSDGVGFTPVSDNEAETFTNDVLIYYILRSIVELQNKETIFRSISTSNSPTRLTTTTTSPVIVPDAKLFPKDQLNNLLIATKFGLEQQELLRVWKRYKFEMPKGTTISLYDRAIAFKKEGYYSLLFWFDPAIKHTGTLPANFIPSKELDHKNIVSFSFTVSMRFEWYRDYAEAEPYKEWAQSLFSGLENRLKQPPL